MALVRKRNYKKIVVYAVMIIIIFIFVGYYLYNSTKSPAGGSTTGGTSLILRPDIISDYDQGLINQSVYQNLEDFGQEDLPLDFKNINKGKANPFSPPQ